MNALEALKPLYLFFGATGLVFGSLVTLGLLVNRFLKRPAWEKKLKRFSLGLFHVALLAGATPIIWFVTYRSITPGSITPLWFALVLGTIPLLARRFVRKRKRAANFNVLLAYVGCRSAPW